MTDLFEGFAASHFVAVVLTAMLITASGALAADQAPKPYAGQQARDVSTLSAKDIEDLYAGRGWGLAKPAELNGYPGPLHVLELASELQLSEGQKKKVQEIFDRMQRAAKSAGAKFIDAEKEVDSFFKAGELEGAKLAEKLDAASAARAGLRRVHLSAHIETKGVLSTHQIHRYKMARGYDGGGHHDHQGSHGGMKH